MRIENPFPPLFFFKGPKINLKSVHPKKSVNGQEIANYKYFESVHFGKYFRTSFGLNRYIKKMLADDDLLYKYSREIKLNTSNDAMKKLYKLIKDII